MRKKHFLVACFIAVLAGFIAVNLLLSQSPYIEALSDDTIDVSDINISDYLFIFKGEQNTVFFRKNTIEKQVVYDNKPLTSIALSPSQMQVGFFYHPNDATTEEASLVIYNLYENTFQKIYHTTFASWDIRGALYWLDDAHVFFKRHCGTSCHGLTLLNIKSKSTTHAVLSFPPLPDMPEKTHFKDWFGNEYEMEGLVDDVRSVTENGLHYMVFMLKNYEGNSVGQKRFLFTGDALEDVSISP
ncbi:hypothetical protein COU87_01845 [Candidatus Roizmanbacteria bacterium CG10_big_fil_rev_8_21_14_0_10_39_12]|uniref:Uncharacterized protein n=1 Tax=Candidatus Roizmanbacteria bacterium CG10_big_fil_rev_8_21_14_0_10_39_12 TaxID=1974852 RepID=A0A2M8KPV2_9BACT|nr:MAG: hypothetical protein COY15_00970 [Candidatus Roizmanbacteria bacterium CG_4_10_14_0_2_um_filter_39_12]PJE61938.1 MAG: hypothetical protein COU87_01845 [Candidatus Roizmanbacteria bacterium CG10_big_fil_rev_8_21_14_0_10_39_12]